VRGCVVRSSRRAAGAASVSPGPGVNLLTRTAWRGPGSTRWAPRRLGLGGDGPVEALVASPALLGFQGPTQQQGRSRSQGLRWWTGHPRWWQEWRQLIVALALLLLSCWAISPGLARCRVAAWCPLVPRPGGQHRPARAGGPIWCAEPGKAAHGLPSMDTLVGLGW